ncbi:SDR family oxidoreductase, partial [Streptomyces sp. SID10244]|nr:SDR family oxidoreductase [Streptomyces sp. SID10244]
GAVNTAMGSGDMVEKLMSSVQTNPQLGNMGTPFLPDWIAEPEDIADTVVWLASDAAKRITAAAIAVDLGNTQY